MDAFVITNHRHEIVRPIGRFAGLTLIEVRAKQELGADERTGTIEDKKRERRRTISWRWISDRGEALVRMAADDSVWNRLET